MEANPRKQKEWMTRTVSKIKETVKTHRAILYFEDESNISLFSCHGNFMVSTRGSNYRKKYQEKEEVFSAISAISNDGRLLFSLHNSGKRI